MLLARVILSQRPPHVARVSAFPFLAQSAARKPRTPARGLCACHTSIFPRAPCSTRFDPPNRSGRIVFAIDDFFAWYGSEPRLAFNKTASDTASNWNRDGFTMDHKPAARSGSRLAYRGRRYRVPSPELAAGIRRVKGARRIGVFAWDWLSAEQVKTLLRSPNLDTSAENATAPPSRSSLAAVCAGRKLPAESHRHPTAE